MTNAEPDVEPTDPLAAEKEEDGKRFSAFHANLAELYLGSVARTRSAAEAVRNAAAAIGTIYAAVLGLIFLTNRPLPLRGLIPAVFLGLAIAGASAYLAYMRPWVGDGRPPSYPEESARDTVAAIRAQQDRRTRSLRRQAQKANYRRSYLLRVAVLSLGFAVLFLPAAFVRHPGAAATSIPLAWPRAPITSNEPSLALYKAQLREVAEQRAASSAGAAEASSVDRFFDRNGWIWSALWGLAMLLSLGFVLVYARFWAKFNPGSDDEAEEEEEEELAAPVDAVSDQPVTDSEE